MNYNKDGLNVLCAFQTSALSLLFVASVVGILAIAVIGRIGQSCTESVIVIIFAISTASFLLPIVIYAFLASDFDSKASYALHDLANLSRNLRQRRDFAYTSWEASNSGVLKQWQEQRALDHDQLREQRSLTLNPMYDSSEYSQRDMLFTVATPEHFKSITESMSNSLTPVRFLLLRKHSSQPLTNIAHTSMLHQPQRCLMFLLPSQLPRLPHFQKQLISQCREDSSPSFLDYMEAMSSPDLLALEVSAQFKSRAPAHFPFRLHSRAIRNSNRCSPFVAACLTPSFTTPAPAACSVLTSTRRSWPASLPSSPPLSARWRAWCFHRAAWALPPPHNILHL
jgi:hypothetical protein